MSPKKHKTGFDKAFASSVNRAGMMEKRTVKRRVCSQVVADAFGAIEHGCEIFALSKGQYSVIDVLDHVLDYTGPADLVISTWNISANDARFLSRMRDAGRVGDVRLILDGSFARREPESNAWLVEKFGSEALRQTVNHAKFIVVKNAEWNVSIRTSANMNENLCMEIFEVSDCPLISGLLCDYADEAFSLYAAGESRAAVDEKFRNGSLFGESLTEQSAARRMEGEFADSKKYFGDGRYSRDLRRVGLSCQ